MKIKILLIILFACAICSGQSSDMELPAYNGGYRSVSTPYYPIYILKTEEIILFNDTISPADLSKALYKGIPNYGSYFMIPKAQVHLIIDKDVAYETLYTSAEKPTAQSSTFHFARTSQNKKSLPLS
jgi:biopolymer transport protein ExbD